MKNKNNSSKETEQSKDAVDLFVTKWEPLVANMQFTAAANMLGSSMLRSQTIILTKYLNTCVYSILIG